MKGFINELKRKIGKSNEIVLTREELFILIDGFSEKDTEPLEQMLLKYYDKIKYKIKDDETFLEFKEELQKIKSQNLSEHELYLLIIKLMEKTLI